MTTASYQSNFTQWSATQNRSININNRLMLQFEMMNVSYGIIITSWQLPSGMFQDLSAMHCAKYLYLKSDSHWKLWERRSCETDMTWQFDVWLDGMNLHSHKYPSDSRWIWNCLTFLWWNTVSNMVKIHILCIEHRVCTLTVVTYGWLDSAHCITARCWILLWQLPVEWQGTLKWVSRKRVG